MRSGEEQFLEMTRKPVGRLIVSLGVPTVVSMLVSAIYNTADTYFVSKLGTSASGAVGIVFSLMAIIQAVGFTLGMGAGSWISRLLGAHREDEASAVAASGFYASIAFGLLLAAFGLAFLDPLVRLLGATGTIAPYARDYASYILFAAPVMAASFVLNNVLRAEGKARLAMAGIAAGGILNLALDPLFIFAFGMGIGGAALATALSQCVSFLILLASFLRGRTITKLGLGKASRGAGTYLRILKNGLPSLSRQGLASVSTIVLNLSASSYGDAAVAAMSIVAKIVMLVFSAIIGIGQGYQPVLGYNYGARRWGRVREAFFFTLKLGCALMTASAAALFIAAEGLVRLFIASDPEVIAIGSAALRAQCLAMPLIPLGVMCNMTFQSIGESWTATFLSATRQGLFLIPLLLALSNAAGLRGIQAAQPAADLCTFLCCVPFALAFLRRLRAEG